MAKITFTLEELVELLISNELLPRQIMRARVKDEKVHFVIKTQSSILPFIPASVRFLGFENNNARFELSVVSGRLSKSISRFRQAFSLKIPAYMKIEYPNIYVDVDRLLKEKNIRGVRVKDIFFEDGEFVIVFDKI